MLKWSHIAEGIALYNIIQYSSIKVLIKIIEGLSPSPLQSIPLTMQTNKLKHKRRGRGDKKSD